MEPQAIEMPKSGKSKGPGQPKGEGVPASTSLRPTEAVWNLLLDIHGRFPGLSRHDVILYALDIGLRQISADPEVLNKRILESLQEGKK